MSEAGDLSVLGEPLRSCSTAPMTGFERDGVCRDCPGDGGRHIVCVRMTADFLAHSREAGNDLSTPRPEFGFPGLQPGDCWCLCASRWLDAHRAGCAPPVVLAATSAAATEVIPLDALRAAAADLS